MSDIGGRVAAVPLSAVSRRRSVGWLVCCCNRGCGCGGYGWSRGCRHSNDRPSWGLMLMLVTQGGRRVADAVPVRRQPGRVGIGQISPIISSTDLARGGVAGEGVETEWWERWTRGD